MQVQPYLFFDGSCEEAIEFYRTALGAEVTMLMHFRDAPKDGSAPGEDCAAPVDNPDHVMYSSLRFGDSVVMASDGLPPGQASHQGFALSLTAKDGPEAERLFAALSEGGQVQMPLTKTFFSSHFGMVADRFGVAWMVLVGS
jgi:PhnB protein